MDLGAVSFLSYPIRIEHSIVKSGAAAPSNQEVIAGMHIHVRFSRSYVVGDLSDQSSSDHLYGAEHRAHRRRTFARWSFGD